MNRFCSAEAVYVDEASVRLYFARGPNGKINDSHLDAREQNGLRDDGRIGTSRPTRLEYIPHTAMDDFTTYQLVLDAGHPDWWTDAHARDATHQFQRHIHGLLERRELVWHGDCYLDSLTHQTAPIRVAGYCFLGRLTHTYRRGSLTAARVWDGNAHVPLVEFRRRLAITEKEG